MGAVTARWYHFRGGAWDLNQRPHIFGIMNVTPDSFSDGGTTNHDPLFQVEKAERLLQQGADGLDLGAESTRPGHQPVPWREEWERLDRVLRAVRRALPDVPLSIDTQKAEVAERALDAGADIINDIWGFSRDPRLARVVSQSGAGAILMFNRAEDASLPIAMDDLRNFFLGQLDWALEAGIPHERVLIDPGIGFRVQGDASWSILHQLERLRGLGAGILVGHSRKRFLGRAANVPEARDRDLATAVVSALVALEGADVLRVHDPASTRQALLIANQWRMARGQN
jgi:dihydropteroate synthase